MINIRFGAGWVRKGGTHTRGYAFHRGRYFAAAALAQLLEDCRSPDAWRATVCALNGHFALVSERGGSVLAAVDRLRSIPLFYAQSKASFYLGDDAYWVLRAAGGGAMDEVAKQEFVLTGYVTGTDTLVAPLKQLRAGQLMSVDEASTKPSFALYYEYRHKDFWPRSTDQLITDLEAVHTRVFKRLVESVDGRAIIVPLSGGYDSRLIGVALRDAGLHNVICYSYGVPGNWESRISQELASHLGFRWEFIPYTAEDWRAWASLREFEDYFRLAGNLTSVPHVQDWPAVLELHRRRQVPPDGVFVPGHSGDFLAGSHVPKWYLKRARITRREVLDSIYKGHYCLWDWPADHTKLRVQFDRRIEAVTGPLGDCSPEQAADSYELWDLQERQAKFICNALRVYEFFGHEWRLPLFDHELMDFWARVPVEKRHKRSLYFEFVARRQDLPITKPNHDRHRVVDIAANMLEKAGLWSLAKAGQRLLRKLHWEREYLNPSYPPFAWNVVVERDTFRRTYTGKETLHSYLARRYVDFAVGDEFAQAQAAVSVELNAK